MLDNLILPLLSFPFNASIKRMQYDKEMAEYNKIVGTIDQYYQKQVDSIEGTYAAQVKAIDDQYAAEMEAYNRNLSYYNQNIYNDEIRVQTENRQIQAINSAVNLLLKKYAETEAVLKELYDHSPITSTYRHIIPVGYMNELLKLRVCNRLDGKDGLNYIVRSELSNRQIVADTDDVISDFDTLISSKMHMYFDIKDRFGDAKSISDETIRLIMGYIYADTSVGEIEQLLVSCPVQTYIDQRTAKEQEYASSPLFQ